jgi:hypothetical protein
MIALFVRNMNKRLQACHLRYNDEVGNYTVSGCIGTKTGLKCPTKNYGRL